MGPVSSTHSDVYVAGVRYIPNQGYGLEYWKNGALTSLGDSNYLAAECQGMTVSGTDVYISAIVSADPVSADQISEFWKNGVVNILPKGFGISNIVVSDGNVYFAATDSAGTAQYWKNDSIFLLSDGSGNKMTASCIFVTGQSVYVGGIESFPNVGLHPIYWLNSLATTLPTPMASDCWVSGISVLNSGVFLCGYDNNYAAYWNNAGETLLDTVSSLSRANSIFISGNDIYIGGYDGNFAVYWKNGQEVKLTDGANIASVLSIFVSGNDIYAAGADNGKAVYWDNGNRVALPDSTQAGLASAIFVQ